jgi:putative peptidoglycan lipid II flippase
MLLLRRALNSRIGRTGLPGELVAKLWGATIISAAVAWGIKLALPSAMHPVPVALAVVAAYGLAFFSAAIVLRIAEASTSVERILRVRRGR